MPTFSMGIADLKGFSANIGDPRAFYLDIYTAPGSIYRPIDVEIVMPETEISNNIPAATVCRVTVFYAGVFSSCIRKGLINDPKNNQIQYLQRLIITYIKIR